MIRSIIFKSFNIVMKYFLYKALPPGTRRKRKDGIYEKQPTGKWLKVTEKKPEKEEEKKYNTQNINANEIDPPHKVKDEEKFEKIKENMENQGWKGRPILAIDMGDNYEALTGSHRIAAAQELGIEIPVVLIELENSKQYDDIMDSFNNPEQMVNLFEDYGLEDAKDLMTEEILSNLDDL